MDNKRKRELTMLRVRKHRAVKKQMSDEYELSLEKSPVPDYSKIADEAACSSENFGYIEPNNSPVPANEGEDTGEDSEDVEDIEQEEEEEDREREIEAEEERERESEIGAEEEERASEEEEGERESESESEEEEDSDDEVKQLKKWAIKSGVNFVHVDSLLAILRRRLLPELPKSYKTFLQTESAAYNIVEMEDSNGEQGEFVYFGISEGLRACINKDLHPDGKIYLQLNVDGIPIFQSSYAQFWPILCKVFHSPDVYRPFLIAIYFGASKPKNMGEYLDKFVEEMNILSVEGISINGETLQVYIQCFICDTPARSMMKCIKGHTGFYACERCSVRGYKVGGSTVFPTVNSPRRTDEGFRNQEQPEHHNGVSPLLNLTAPINMITVFVLDSMHLFFGIMKKVLMYWLVGNLYVRLGRRYRTALSERMEYLKSSVPCEFQRKPRSVKYIAQWKATELRFFLLYCGPIVLKDILHLKLYKHFLLLHVAYRILCSPELCLKYNEQADHYLRTFFMVLKEYYGRDSQIMNAHNLIHVAEDVKNMNCDLTRISAFPFENMLGTIIKKAIRTPNRPLAQVCRRLHEQKSLATKVGSPPVLVVLRWKNDVALNDTFSIQKLKFKEFTLSTNCCDDKVLLTSGEVLKINKMHCPIDDMNNVTIEGSIWRVKRSVYTYPCDSKHFKMWELDKKPSSRRISCDIHRIKHKMVFLALPRQQLPATSARKFVMPLLHTT